MNNFFRDSVAQTVFTEFHVIDIDIAYDGLRTGPGGTHDKSLDGGNWSSHGYSDVNKLPDGS